MKYFFLIAILTFFVSISFGQKRKLNANLKNSSVMYHMSHPLHDWDASTKEFKAIIAFNDNEGKVEAAAVVIPVKSFDSGNSNRDSHALEELEVLKFPNVSFSCSNLAYNGKEVVMEGKLNFHGIEKPITINAHQELTKKLLSVSGKFEINMTEFGVKPPGLMGMTTKEEIRLDFMFSFDL
jgi:polyisoprenoid-binding protein YceI